jgi:hypothetical protein
VPVNVNRLRSLSFANKGLSDFKSLMLIIEKSLRIISISSRPASSRNSYSDLEYMIGSEAEYIKNPTYDEIWGDIEK